MSSKIEWTDETWNVITGCTKVSPGCDNCYAERITERWSGPGSFEQLVLHEDRTEKPLRWQKPRMVFVNSMSDLFHEDVPDELIARMFVVMSATPQHTYQILTKRHGRMRSLLREDCFHWLTYHTWPLPNVWLGVSAEDQKRANLRLLPLLDTPARVRFLSAEPLLGPINLYETFGTVELSNVGLDWVIVGGESGTDGVRRPMQIEWMADLVAQCRSAGIACFVKQDSGRQPGLQGAIPDDLWKVKEWPS